MEIGKKYAWSLSPLLDNIEALGTLAGKARLSRLGCNNINKKQENPHSEY